MGEIKVRVTPVREMYYNNDYGIYACVTDEVGVVKYNKYGNFSIKGNCVRLKLDNEYNATLEEKQDKKYGIYYEIKFIHEDIPTDVSKQRNFLLSILTPKQVDEIYKAYPNDDIIQLIKDDQFDVSKVKGIGKKTYLKIRDRIIENLEFQQAFEFLSGFGVTNNLIIKLVKHFKSASLLIKKMKDNPYCIVEVSGIGFKKADTIAMAMGYDPNGEFRIVSAIEYVIDEESGNGHTYCKVDKVIDTVYEMINVDFNNIGEQIRETDRVIVLDDKIALKKNYYAEQYIANRLKKLVEGSSELDIDVDAFIEAQEEEHGITLTEQQKSFFHNVKQHNVNILAGFAGCGKSMLQKLLIHMLDQLHIPYRLLAPTGKAAKVLSAYTNRDVTTIHRAIGLGERKEEEAQFTIDEEFVVVDETSMADVQLTAKLLKKCTNENLRILFIGDPFQIPSVSAGNVLHDCIESKIIPTTKLDQVFRQKEGGILDIVTKIRLGQKFIDNNFIGLQEYGNNCILASVPQDKMQGGYKYFYNDVLKQYDVNDITIVTPTKKSKLGTIEVNEIVQEIVNPESDNKLEKEFGFNKTIFREGDIVLNTKNTYKMLNCDENEVDIVNGDIGVIEKIDNDEQEIIVDFVFDRVPIPFGKLCQLLHAWCMTMHKMQGSSAKVIIAIADKSHKFQLNANLIYTAFTRPEERLIIISQAETINYAMKKVANLSRNTFLGSMLASDNDE